MTVTLISEAMILLVAAQTGFLDGPRVLANMATDGWMPRQFSMLSDRLVTQNGILLMGAASVLLLWITKGDVTLLVILYSINVFLTFTLSQTGDGAALVEASGARTASGAAGWPSTAWAWS